MKTKVKLYLALLLVGFLSAAVLSYASSPAIAQEDQDHSDTEESAIPSEQVEEEASQQDGDEQGDEQEAQTEQQTEEGSAAEEQAQGAAKYVYVAQPGDSYTLMARKAVQTYGKKFDVNLSLSGIIFAETNLTKLAGFPELEVGQEVSIEESLVKDWAERALTLTDEEKAAWEYYVQFVNFNTDSVGEAS